jgi:pimeloyl-ACP methyl ester carboxylesterase
MPLYGKLYYSQHCESGTENPPLILIHGAAGTHLYWPPEIRRLSGYCVFAPDLPGHGKSSALDGQQTIDDYVRYLLQWLESIQIRRAVFIGHSMGGAIALSLAINHPEYVVALGLISSGARLRVNPDVLKFAADSTTYIKSLDLLVSCSFSADAAPRLVQLASKHLLETRHSVFLGDMQACDRFDVMDQLSEVIQPTLVVCGEEDQMTPTRYAQYLSSSIPNAQLLTIPNAGHMVMLEQPVRVADGLLAFLNEITFYPGEEF